MHVEQLLAAFATRLTLAEAPLAAMPIVIRAVAVFEGHWPAGISVRLCRLIEPWKCPLPPVTVPSSAAEHRVAPAMKTVLTW